MSLPSKPQQIAAIVKFLDADFQEGKSLEEIAKAIVEGYHDVLTSDLKVPATTPRLGMLFKTPIDGKVRRWVWEGEGSVWIVGESDSYGWLGSVDNSFLELCEEYRPKRKLDGKMIKLSDEEIDAEWDNPDWKIGDVASQSQRQYSFEVIAVAPQSVLMRNTRTGFLTVDSNANLARYYRREREVQEW